jgi:hypothetical protein
MQKFEEETQKINLSEYCSKAQFFNREDNPLKKSEFDWLFKNRDQNGFKKAFVKVSARCFLVHLPTFSKCLSDRKGF